MLLGSMDALRPNDLIAERLTGPEKPLMAPIVMVDVPGLSVLIVKVYESAEIEKSGPVTSMETNSRWISRPLTPVIITVYEPGTTDVSTSTVTIAEPEPGKEEGLTDAVIPVTVAEARRVIERLNPFRETAVTVDAPLEPASMIRRSGSGERLKSGPVTKTPTVAKWTRGPLSASIVT